jgi:acyl-CoA reductase-like NAD-dependent aldehyde dehydrogenase
MTISSREVDRIVRRVRQRYGKSQPEERAEPAPSPVGELAGGVFGTVDEAVGAAARAYEEFSEIGLERRKELIDRIREDMRADAEELGRLAQEETGLGRPEDKTVKNLLVTNKTPGPEDLEPTAVTGDHGMTVTEYAPFGIIGAITPTTNPTSTIINNSIAIVSAGNALVFNVHPAAKRVSAENVRRINRSIVAAGGPRNLVTCIAEPTIESAQDLMHHRAIRVLMVTGGPGVVQEALKTTKRAITAGPGNPPVLVDQTADIDRAAREIIRGASFDNNVVCVCEKETLVVAGKARELVSAFDSHGAVVLKEYQLRQLEKVIFKELGRPNEPGRINPKWIGQHAGKILREIGISASDSVRLIVAEVPTEHSLVWTEQMMPVMPVARVRTVDEGIDLAVRAEHRFRHTASIHSNDVETITRMARAMNVSIFVANSANIAGLGAGGEDFTSFSIATPTGEGLSRPRTFSRIRRLTVAGSLRIT